MLSREQAELAGDALVAAAKAEKERAAERDTRSLVRLYPALRHVQPLGRYAALSDARDFAARYVSSRLFLALISLTLAALVALGLTGHAQLALASGYLAALLSIGSRVAEFVLVRQHLSRSLRQNAK